MRGAQEKKKVKGWSTEEMKDKTRSKLEDDTGEMMNWRSMSQENMDQCWKKLAEKNGGRGFGQVQGRGQQKRGLPKQPFWNGGACEKQEVQNTKWREDCWARIFALFRDYNLQRRQSMHEDFTEEEEMRRQHRMKIKKDLTKKIRSKVGMDAENRWWVAELLATDCEKAWLDPGEEETMRKSYVQLEKMKKEDKKRKMEELHQQRVNQMIKSAEGSAGLLHKLTKPTAWRGGAQILKKEEENARLLDRCEAKRKEWAKQWQCDESVQNMEDKHWKNEQLKKLEEALPRLKECEFENVSRLYKAKTRVGCDGFHPKVHLDLTKETREEVVELLEKVEQSGKWSQQACTTKFFLIPKNVACGRSFALLLTLIRWWEALRAPEVAKSQQKYRVAWDATDGRYGGAQQTVWEFVLEKYRAGEEDVGAVALVLVLAKAFERVSLPVVWTWATHVSFRRKILWVLCGYFEHQRRIQFEGCAAEPFLTITAILPGSKLSCLLLRVVLQDALSEVTNIYPPLKLRAFVDNITALLMEKNKEVAEMAMKVKEEVERKGFKMSVTESGKERKSKMIASCGCVNAANDDRQCRNAWSGFDNESKKVGRVKEKARRKKCKVRFSLIKKNKVFQKNYMKVGVKNLLRAGMVPARTWGVHAVEIAPTERFIIEEADWQQQRAKKNTTSLSLFMEAFGLESGKRALYFGYSNLGQKGYGQENGTQNKKKHG